jgi:putative transposase
LNQIPKDAEFANANLIRKSSGFYLKVTCFMPIETSSTSFKKSTFKNSSKEIVGIDFGIKDDLTLSNGIKFQTKFPITEKIKKSQRKLSRKKKYSKNYEKQRIKASIVYEKHKNRKIDTKTN